MSDDTDKAQDTDGKTVEPMPSSEVPAEQPAAVLPEDSSERTKQEFEKLKAHNAQLAEELSSFKQAKYSSVLDELRPQPQVYDNLNQQQVDEVAQGLVDDNGYIDQDLLNKKLSEADSRAKSADERAANAEARVERIERAEETKTTREAHTKYPQLDPYSPSFDRRFYDMVKNEMIGQYVQGQNDLIGAADKVNAFLSEGKAEAKVAEAESQAKQEVTSQREQASTTAVASGAVPNSTEYDQLIEGTRAGDSTSIGKRLMANDL